MSSPTTLTVARQYVGREAGPFHAGTADTTSTAGGLIDLTWPIKNTSDTDTLYQDHFLYRPAAATASDKTRTVRIYTPAGGSLAPDLTYAGAPDAGEAYELGGTLDPTAVERAINDALKDLMIDTTFTITPTAGNTRHPLPAGVATWLSDPSWIRQVGYLASNETRDQTDPFDRRVVRGEAYKDGGTLYLYHRGRTFDPASTTLYVRALKPAYYHCRTSSAGTFGDSSGLSAEAHEAPVDHEWLAAAALVECWRRHGQLLETGANAKLIKDFGTALAWKTDQTELHGPQVPLTFLPPVVSWGPGHSSSASLFDF